MTKLNQAGQAITEAVLILVLLFGFTTIVANYFKDQEFFKQLVSGPWQNVAGMLQNGVWDTPSKGAIKHPSGHGRHIVIVGEPAR